MKRAVLLAVFMLFAFVSGVSADSLTGTATVSTGLYLDDANITQNQITPLLNVYLKYGDNVTVDGVIIQAEFDGTVIGNYTAFDNKSTITLPRLSPGTHGVRLTVLSIPRENVVDYVTGEVIPVVVELSATTDREAIAINKGEVGKVTVTVKNTGNVPMKVNVELTHAATGLAVDSKEITVPANSTAEVVLSDSPQSNTDYKVVVRDDKFTYAEIPFRILVYGGGVLPAAPSTGELPPEAGEFVEEKSKENVIFYVIGEIFGFKVELWMPFAMLGLYGALKGDKNLALIGFGFLAFFYLASPLLVV